MVNHRYGNARREANRIWPKQVWEITIWPLAKFHIQSDSKVKNHRVGRHSLSLTHIYGDFAVKPVYLHPQIKHLPTANCRKMISPRSYHTPLISSDDPGNGCSLWCHPPLFHPFSSVKWNAWRICATCANLPTYVKIARHSEQCY